MKARGLSLLEIMMVIAVTAIILIIAVDYFTNIRLSSKVNQTVMQVRDLYQGGVNYFNAQKYQATSHATTGDIIPTLINGNYIPPSDQISPWGSNQKNMVKVTLSSAPNGNQLIIIIPTLPIQACNVITNRLKSPFPDANYSTCNNAPTKGLTITFTLNFTD
jgi:Tfp pilus assembly protein PilE